MAKLTYEKRKEMPKKSFALPSTREKGKGGFPIPDKAHARNALARVSESLHKGNITEAQAEKVRAKAKKKLYGTSKPTAVIKKKEEMRKHEPSQRRKRMRGEI